jgi:uncharacterized membrane protein
MTVFIIILIIAAIIAVIVAIARYNKKCARCKKWGAMKYVKKVNTGTRHITIYRDIETKDRNGKVIATTQIPVPGTRYYYDNHRKCKHCGYKDIVKSDEDYENT